MRWWIHTDPPRIMSVDNGSVTGMDFSTLTPDIWMVQWMDGKGEIERQDVETNANLNGLRESFTDVLPYAPFFQQFLTRMKAKALLLPQAKKVQIDLIRQIFESKRQAPFHHPIATGDYYWDATDETLFASTSAGLLNTIVSLNRVIAELNAANASAIPHTNIQSVCARWIPIDAIAPVNVTAAEQAEIMNGIAARTDDLNGKKNVKIDKVNALTTIDDVIVYDVTVEW